MPDHRWTHSRCKRVSSGNTIGISWPLSYQWQATNPASQTHQTTKGSSPRTAKESCSKTEQKISRCKLACKLQLAQILPFFSKKRPSLSNIQTASIQRCVGLYLKSFLRDMFFSESFFMTLETAISKSS